MRFGYIGLGNIGAPMAARIAAAGSTLTVFDAVPAAMEKFGATARLAASPAELGRETDAVAICVRDDDDVTAVVAGPDGLLAGMTGGVIAIHSTVRPATVVALAELATGQGVAVLDAAVTGGADGAERGQLTCMVGGPADALEKVRPLLDHYCASIIHAGPAGAGMALKIANNLVTYVELVAALEGYRLAEAAGLDPALLDAVMTNNGNLTPAMNGYIRFRRTGPPSLGEGPFLATQQSLSILAEKDLDLAIEIAGALDLSLPAAERVRAIFRQSATRI